MKNKYISAGFLIGLFSLTFIACDDNIDPLVEALELNRQFTPTVVTTTNGQTQASIQWSASLFTEPDGVSYFIEISKDETFAVIAYSLTTTEIQAVITNEDIEIKQDHFARVKALGQDGREDSGWKVSGAFKITGEQIFLPVTEADLAYNAATVKWTVSGTVTTLTVAPEGGQATEFTLTDDEKLAGAKTITGLLPATTYTAEIFNGTTNRGTTTFTTFSLEVPDADLIVYLDNTHVFSQNTFDTLTVASVTFVFPQGTVYGSTTRLTLKDNMDITFFGVPGANKPVMAFNGFKLPSVAGKIRFENIDLTGYENNNPSGTKYGYLFNQNSTADGGSQTAEIIFENCIIRNFANTPLRLQQSTNAITVELCKVNNCIVYDISAAQTYAFIHQNGATISKVNNIEITNSTFYNLRIGLIRHDSGPSQSVTITDCTINDISEDTRAIIDYNAQTVTTFTFTANILGKTKGSTTVRGIRIAGAAVSVPSSSYKTSDHIVATEPVGGVTAYSSLSTDLFQNPSVGDFHFKDAAFAGKSTSGDPRWRP